MTNARVSESKEPAGQEEAVIKYCGRDAADRFRRIIYGPDRFAVLGTLLVFLITGILFLVFEYVLFFCLPLPPDGGLTLRRSNYICSLSPVFLAVFIYVYLLSLASFIRSTLSEPGIIPRNMSRHFPREQSIVSCESASGAATRPLPILVATQSSLRSAQTQPVSGVSSERDLRVDAMAYPFGTNAESVGVREIVVNAQSVFVKYCHTCHFFRPPRCSHCSDCDGCIGI